MPGSLNATDRGSAGDDAGPSADAVWLAQQGWQVTAVEPSAAAIAHARHAATEAGVDVRFVHTEIADAGLPRGGFALVSAFYPALRRTPDGVNEQALLDAVAEGGELLWVHHATIDRERALEHGFDPDDYVSVDNVRDAAGTEFEVLKDYRRDRSITGGQGIEHIEDVVLRLRRR